MKKTKKQLCIFSPHEDKFDNTNRNLNYSNYLKKHGIDCTLYVSNFNFRTKKKKKLKNFFYEIDTYNSTRIVRLNTTKFFSNGFDRMLSYIVFFFNSLFYFFFFEKNKFNLIIGESVPPLIGLSAFFCSLKNKSKFIYQIRDIWPIRLYYSGLLKKNSLTFIGLEFINKFLINRSIFIISSLPNLKDYLKSKYHYKKEIYHLPNGSDISTIKKKIKNKKINFENNCTRLIYAGGFSPAHEILNYFKAIENIQKRYSHYNIFYKFYGDGIELDKCKSFVRKKRLKNVEFHSSVKKDKIYKILLKNNLGICTISKDKNERFGYNLNKMYDYLVCGLPIIFTNDYYKNKFIEKNKFGFNCNPNYRDISKKIVMFHKLSLKRKALFSSNAKKYCEKIYDVRNLAAKLSKILLTEKNEKSKCRS